MKKSIYIVLYNIRSLYNVGAIFRSADAFGVEKIFLCGISAFPPKRQMEKIAKTALGAEKNISWEYHKRTATLLKKLKQENIHIVALESNISRKLQVLKNFRPRFPLALIVGNEIKGISKNILALSDDVVTIPMVGKKDSLNVSVAASIALYELTKK